MQEQLRASYREEAADLLQQLERTLLELEKSPLDSDLVGRAFRQMHTIKGSGAMFGFDEIAGFTHQVETVFDLVRARHVPVTPALISLSLEARDYIQNLLDAAFGGPPPPPALGDRLRRQFGDLSGRAEPRPLAGDSAAASQPIAPARYRIRFEPPADVFRSGTRLLPLLLELQALGQCSLCCFTDRIPLLDALDPELCYLRWEASLATPEPETAIREVFLFVEEDSVLSIEPDSGQHSEGPRTPATKSPESNRVSSGETSTIRVPADKLDNLVNAVGEMVTAQARLGRLAASLGDPELDFVCQEMERLIDRLRAETMGMRMLPIGATFSRFGRLVRDLSRELGKQVELLTDGGETEIDKNVLELLNDPLVHIIRNAIDHGIESPAARAAAGKPTRGTLRLTAIHAGGHVLIRVSDDGAGLDPSAILAKAVERGLVPPENNLAETEIYRLIFHPGFSTASRITEVSGRGVGLDVVQKNITALRGSVEVRSRQAEGTSFTLKLPLTLAIIDGLLVSSGAEYFVFPLSNVQECVELHENGRRAGNTVTVRNELIPYISLRKYFRIPGNPPPISQVMLVDTELGRFGLAVDRVIGDHQTVIKNLGPVFRCAEAVSGATILGDGSVALILDLERLVRDAMEQSAARVPAK